MIFAGVGGVFLLVLGVLFWTNPALGFEQTGHRAEQLPAVMADRYFAFALIGVFAALYGDPNVVMIFFAACAVMAFVDALIYRRAGQAIAKHVIAGVLSLVALAVTCAASLTEGAA
jgi:hypothetical protein